MTLHDTISRMRLRLGKLLPSIGSRMPLDWGHWARDLFAGVRQTLMQAATYAQSRMPWVRSYRDQLLDWMREGRERLRRIALGARTIQAVGAAVVLGTLYVAIWGVGPSQSPQSPDLVATRTAPIGTLTLQEPSEPQVAEQVSTANAAATSM